jgi:sugar lactone lactonase YvrE
MTVVGSGKYTYEVQQDWFELPEGWRFGWIPAVACDSQDRVYVYSRSEHPMVVFDRTGRFVASWGDEVLKDAHGIFIDAEDQVWCIEREVHCVHKFTRDGELLMTLGNPGQEGAVGQPFRLPTDLTLDAEGHIYVCDGYDNACVHKYAPDGEFIKTWGAPGTGPGQFDLPHCVRFDARGRLMVADRSNNRIQFFDTDGNYLEEWGGFNHPDTIFLDGETVYVAELDQRVSIVALDGERLTEWGSGERIDKPGEFLGCPPGIWMDSRGDLYVGEVQTDQRIQKFVRRG